MSTLPPVFARAAFARVVFALIATIVVLGGITMSDVAGAAPEKALTPSSSGDGFTSLAPARLLDTRAGTATVDGQYVGTGAVQRTADLLVAGRGGVPATGARAVALNITVTAPTNNSFLTVWPAGAGQPNASNINFVPGQTVANAVIVQLGAGGKINFFNETGSTDLIVDVVGWFAGDADYTPRVPARVLDSRPDGATVDGAFVGNARPANTPIALTVAGRANVPANASAVVLNVTIVAPTANSFATVWPQGSAIPNASNLNFEAGRNVANLVVAEIGDNGQVSINFAAGNAFVLADVVGWFGNEFDFEPVLPARLLDTRSANATIDGAFSGAGPLNGGGRLDVHVLGRGGVPSSGVDAVVVNVTATQPTRGSFVTVWPTDGQGPPNASTLNVVAGRTVPNLAIVKVGAGGNISLFNEQGSTQLIVDVVGWFPTTFDISTPALTPAVVGTAFSQTLGVVGPSGGLDWGWLDTAPGLTGSAGGTLSGTPTVAGTYSTVAAATNNQGGGALRFLPHFVFSAADGFTPVTATTLFDSYDGAAPIPANTTQTLTATGVAGVPAGAEAVVVNVTATAPASNFLTVWRSGAQPNLASMILTAGEVASQPLVVPLDGSGRLDVKNFGAADYKVDLLGYFGSTSSYELMTPVRVYDSRGAAGPFPAGTTRTVGPPGLSPTPRAVVLLVTATESAGTGSFDVFPSGGSPQAPTTFDYSAGTSSQFVVVPLGSGSVDIRNRAGSAAPQLIVDVAGYFS